MANVIDYLNWRGDLTFDQVGMNEVDNLLFSALVYINFQGIVPADPCAPGVTLCDAAKEFFFHFDDREKYPLGLIIPKEILKVFRQVAELPRYADIRLTGYVNEICEEREMQFSAVTMRLTNGETVVAFRGTDDTIVGWKEDFKLTYMSELPSQRKAVQYLNDLPEETNGLYLTGHSKGGNLSVWAAVHAERHVRDRIIRVYSNDGPGFTKEMLQTEAYRAMSDRFLFLVPQSSLIGLLLFNDGQYQVVKSNARGAYQHNPLTWEIAGNAIVRAEELSPKSKKTEAMLRERLARMNADERRMLVKLLFDVVESTGAKTLVEFNEGKIHGAVAMMRAIKGLDKETKESAQFLLSKLFDAKITVEPTMAVVAKKVARSAAAKTTPKSAPRRKRPKPTRDGKICIEFRWNATEPW